MDFRIGFPWLLHNLRRGRSPEPSLGVVGIWSFRRRLSCSLLFFLSFDFSFSYCCFLIVVSWVLKSVLIIRFCILIVLYEKLYSFCKVILTIDSITLYTRLQELLFPFFFFFQKNWQKIRKKQRLKKKKEQKWKRSSCNLVYKVIESLVRITLQKE